jgi:hypothetical protein
MKKYRETYTFKNGKKLKIDTIYIDGTMEYASEVLRNRWENLQTDKYHNYHCQFNTNDITKAFLIKTEEILFIEVKELKRFLFWHW